MVHSVLYPERQTARSAIGGIIELICVTVRFYNENLHNRLTMSDIIHHLVLYAGTGLCFLSEPCAQYGYLLTHMNILHLPMLLWYGAARRSNFLLAVGFPGSGTAKWHVRTRAIYSSGYSFYPQCTESRVL